MHLLSRPVDLVPALSLRRHTARNRRLLRGKEVQRRHHAGRNVVLHVAVELPHARVRDSEAEVNPAAARDGDGVLLDRPR